MIPLLVALLAGRPAPPNVLPPTSRLYVGPTTYLTVRTGVYVDQWGMGSDVTIRVTSLWFL